MFPFREEDPVPRCKLRPALPKLTYKKSEALSLPSAAGFLRSPGIHCNSQGSASLSAGQEASHERGVQNAKDPKPVVVLVRDNRAAKHTPGAHGVTGISGSRLPL